MNHAKDTDSPQGLQTTWRKSSFSNGTGGNCVEVALLHDCADEAYGSDHKADLGPLIAVRDSKNPDGPQLHFTRSEFAAFRLGIVAGEFDDLG
ncbi:DUF397 domain-containing protein [Nonomuraea mesophila]|uniref:DUF397 domain-containing protein n=1 Tax=Nonomuraea mesophila TaxID=2530382 RepID=A0A4R5FFH1_9ACTN|nr:DUF397 domain-containing protein [Nonomuraea mesophila]TDE49051.1 DUF397 domain-containing protein [Nonomuraea mesophila]